MTGTSSFPPGFGSDVDLMSTGTVRGAAERSSEPSPSLTEREIAVIARTREEPTLDASRAAQHAHPVLERRKNGLRRTLREIPASSPVHHAPFDPSHARPFPKPTIRLGRRGFYLRSVDREAGEAPEAGVEQTSGVLVPTAIVAALLLAGGYFFNAFYL